MKLERGFEKVVDACGADMDVFLALIKLVSNYMRTICTIRAKFSRSLLRLVTLGLTIQTNSKVLFSNTSMKIQRRDPGSHQL